MESVCRLCAEKRDPDELTDMRYADDGRISIADLVRYFCHIELDDEADRSWPTGVCYTCTVTLLKFSSFCESIERSQKKIEEYFDAKLVKPEIAISQIITQQFLPNPANIAHNNGSQSSSSYQSLFATHEELFSPEFPEQFEEMPSLVNGYAESSSSESSSQRSKPQTLPPCFVLLEKLPIVYEFSGTSSEDDEPAPSSRKRSREPIEKEASVSPSKRMRMAVRLERSASIRESVENICAPAPKLIASKPREDISNYKEFYDAILAANHELIPITAKCKDGSVAKEHAERLPMWKEVKLNCTVAGCSESFESPVALLMHKKETHADLKEANFFKCSLCESDDRFSFSKFIKHVHEVHSALYRYCCVSCPKVFFDFICLFNHYQNFHEGLNKIHMCLYDGLLFDSRAGFVRHVSIHEPEPNVCKSPFVKKEERLTRSAVTVTNAASPAALIS